MKVDKVKNYEPPRVITYSAEDIFEEMGPAIACSYGGSNIQNIRR